MRLPIANAGAFYRSVIAVPPLARDRQFNLDHAQNTKLIRHLESGGITTLLYGGNANLYHVTMSEYADIIGMLSEAVCADSWLIPSAGPDFGRLRDQASILKDYSFATVMVLPASFPVTNDGVATGIRKFSELIGVPVMLYLKSESYLDPATVRRLADDGLVAAVKYAISRTDPSADAFLRDLIDLIGPEMLVSGLGERPALTHMQVFGLRGYTSGSVCIAPRTSMAILRSLQAHDDATALAYAGAFSLIEDLRDSISPIRVLHQAVSLSEVADMGPMLPLLSELSEADSTAVRLAVHDLCRFERSLC